jgi:hypothetical protein
MRLLREFRCKECSKVEEHLVNADVREARCKCGGVSTRIIGTPRIALDPISGHFPSATDRWAKAHEEAAKGKGSL